MTNRQRIRLGMVGGGPGSMIGPTHRYAAALDGHYELVAGAFSRQRSRSLELAAELDLRSDRVYESFEEMAEREAARDDGIEAVSIVTPNSTHVAASIAFLERGIHVLCDKPIATDVQGALEVHRCQLRTGTLFALTHNNAAWPMVREARARVLAGELGQVQIVQIEFASGGRSRLVEAEGDHHTQWRTDPEIAGPSAVLADLGVHAHQLLRFATGEEVASVSAHLSIVVAGRRSHDNAQIALRLGNGARGALWASYVAAGSRQGLRLRVFGDKASLEWAGEDPEFLHLRYLDRAHLSLRRGDAWLSEDAQWASRIKAGQPEGVLEAFANLYRDVAFRIRAHQDGTEADPRTSLVAGAWDGVLGMQFIAACLESDARAGEWVDTPGNVATSMQSSRL